MTHTTRQTEMPLTLLHTDPSLQRPLDERRAQRIADDFLPGAVGTITVSHRRSGEFIVIDGQHRTAAARIAGSVKALPAVVHEGLSKADEAALFLRLNNSRQPEAITKFRVRVVEGEKIALAVEAILSSHGWEVGFASTPGVLSAIAAMERVYVDAGGALPKGQHDGVADRTLGILTEAWERDTKSVNQTLLLGTGQLIGRFGGTVDSEKLVSELRKTRPDVLVGRARTLRDAQGGSVPAAMAKILAGMHNNKRRSNLLPEWVWVR